MEGDRLIQRPVREIEACRRNPVRVVYAEVKDDSVSLPGISGNVIELRFTLTPGDAARAGVKLFCDGTHETLLFYDRAEGLVVFDRTDAGVPLTGREADVNSRVCALGPRDSIDFDLFLDVSSLEAFIDGGRHTMTGNVYPDPEKALGIRFFAEGGSAAFSAVEKFDIV